jgi:putative transposase
MNNTKSLYHGHRFPPEIISHAVWLYHRFCLSFRDVEDLLAERGVEVSYESIRQWCMVTDKLRSYSAAKRELMPLVPHCTDQYANNRAELSHQPTRLRERQMRRFKSVGQAQRFLAEHGAIGNLFRLGRHLMRASHYREFRSRSFFEWQLVTCA